MHYANSESDCMGCCIGKYAMTAEESMGKEDYDRLLMPAMGTARRTGSLCAMYFYFTCVNQLNQRNKGREKVTGDLQT